MSSDGEEPFLDRNTEIDELISQTNDLLSGLSGPVNRLNESLGGKERQVVQTLPRRKRSVDMTTKVPSNDTATTTVEMPFNGFVDGIIAGWPDGADLFVGVGLEHEGEKLFPSGNDDFAAYNDFTHEFGVTFPIEKGDEIIARFENTKNVAIPINVSLEAVQKLRFETMDEIRERLD